VTAGITFTQGGRNRSLKEQEIGTLVRLSVESRDGKVLVKLNYEASRLAEHSKEDMLPDTDSVQVSTTLLTTPGRPMLIGSASSDTSSLLLVTVETLN
jgi:hypothetical protein